MHNGWRILLYKSNYVVDDGITVIVKFVCDGKDIHIHYLCEQTKLCSVFVVWFAACPHYVWILIMKK